MISAEALFNSDGKRRGNVRKRIERAEAMGSILKRFDRPSSRKIDPVKSTPEHDAKSLHDSVAATLRMFMEDDQKKAKLAADKREMQARERASFRGKNQEVLAGILKRAKQSK